MIILGIDPGIARCGWGIIEKSGQVVRTVNFGCIETHAKQDETSRLYAIYSKTIALCRRYNPDVIAVEKLFFAANLKTAITVGQARGAILVAAGSAAIPVSSFTPLEVKQAITGYGRAEKEQMQKMVAKTLRLKAVPQPDDTADALAIALTYCFMKRYGRSE